MEKTDIEVSLGEHVVKSVLIRMQRTVARDSEWERFVSHSSIQEIICNIDSGVLTEDPYQCTALAESLARAVYDVCSVKQGGEYRISNEEWEELRMSSLTSSMIVLAYWSFDSVVKDTKLSMVH